MTTSNVRAERAQPGAGWTVLELLAFAPFGFLLWFVWKEPLVVERASVPVAAVAVPQTEPPRAAAEAARADSDEVVYVGTAASTVEQRIAPVARLTMETQAGTGTQEAPAAADQPEAPVTTVTPVAPVAPVTSNAAPAADSITIEIADATGVDGFASGLAQSLEQSGLTVAKATTAAPGSQRRTVILFRKGYEEQARRLSKRFNHPPALVAGKDAETGLRLVLGSAAVRDKLMLAPSAGS